jgi:spore coat polysaccharide biosynthesis protein SpsF
VKENSKVRSSSDGPADGSKRIGIFVNARLGSKRLNDKHLLETKVGPILEVLLKRISHEFAREIANGSVIPLIATTIEPSSVRLQAVLPSQWKLFQGSRENIPLRHLEAAKANGVDAYVSVDGDDILCSVRGMREVYSFLQKGGQYVVTEGFPFGMNSLGFSVPFVVDALRDHSSAQLETGWGRIFTGRAGPEVLKASIGVSDPKLRFTLDYDADFRFFNALIEEFGERIFVVSDEEIISRSLDGGFGEINSSLAEEYWANFKRGQEADAKKGE